jgi:hypothetical protein
MARYGCAVDVFATIRRRARDALSSGKQQEQTMRTITAFVTMAVKALREGVRH